ncbi:MAG: tRNA (adenosine(37)-N6)-threonylcarbamoyltransferase complex dimerization subunit type 1 TsaB [Oligoflexia bacterium]|nr:tRNA (adenosine(37)-N6)-threonylcarbamoyltransferase complex dimerization subunit type 1 TsaB [Oligoflexia bacterium]
MTILALTTSTDRGSLAVLKDNKIIDQIEWEKKVQHSEVLTVFIQKLLQKTKTNPKDLKAIAVDKGPGSFTGCRMAVNVARTMCYTLNIPLFAAHSLDVMAFGARKHKGKIVCVLNAHKSLLYFQWYESDGKEITSTGPAIQAISIEKVLATISPKVFVLGEVPPEIKSKKLKITVPEAVDLALMTIEKKYQDRFQRWQEVEPSYVRVPDVVEKLQKKST